MPAFWGVVLVTENETVAPAVTSMLAEVPVMLDEIVSVAVMAWLPAVFNVTEKTVVPLVRAELTGRID